MQEFNDSGIESKALGFIFDNSEYTKRTRPGQKKIRCDTVTEGSTLTRKDVELSL